MKDYHEVLPEPNVRGPARDPFRRTTRPGGTGFGSFMHSARETVARAGSSLVFSTIVLFVASLVLTKYHVFLDNHAIQLPLVNLLKDPSLYPNDPYGTALSHYASLLWRLVALAAKAIPLEPLFLAAFLLERLFVLYAAGRLAKAFAPNLKLARIATMAAFALGVQPLLGAGTIVECYFEQTGLALGFFLLAIAALHESRPIGWAVWLAIGFNLQSMYGVFAVTYSGAVLVIDPRYRKEAKRWLAALALFCGLASPAIYLGLTVVGHSPINNDRVWLAVSHARCSHHLYPHTWDKTTILRFGMTMALTIAVLWAGRRRHPRLFRHGLAWSVTACSWLLFAVAAAYILRSPGLLVFQPARATDLWLCLAVAAIAAACAQGLEGSSKRDRTKVIPIAAFFVSLLLWWQIGPPWLFATALGLVLVAAQPFSTIVLVKSCQPARWAWLLVTAVAVFAALLLGSRLYRKQTLREALTGCPPAPIEDVAKWARLHTAKSAVFLLDPVADDWDLFRGLSQRSDFTTWREGGAINWDRSFATPWTQRLEAIGFDLARHAEDKAPKDELKAIYDRLSDADVIRLKSQFPLTYWVVPSEHLSRFPTVYQRDGYKVLALQP